MPNILIWDIETTHLCANFGTILCAGFKWLGVPGTHVISLPNFTGWRKDPTDDRRLVAALREKLLNADMLVTYYGEATGKYGFDEPYLISKLLEHNLPPIPKIAHVDVYKTVKTYLRLHRRALGVVADFLQVEGEKTEVKPRIWKGAMVGKTDDLAYVIDHCEKDVDLLERVYLRMLPYVQAHPYVEGYSPGVCRRCGGKLRRRGYAMSRTKGQMVRWFCTSCGGWETRPEKETV